MKRQKQFRKDIFKLLLLDVLTQSTTFFSPDCSFKICNKPSKFAGVRVVIDYANNFLLENEKICDTVLACSMCSYGALVEFLDLKRYRKSHNTVPLVCNVLHLLYST